MPALGYYLESGSITLFEVVVLVYGLIQFYWHSWRHSTPNPNVKKLHRLMWGCLIINGAIGIPGSIDFRGVFGLIPTSITVSVFIIQSGNCLWVAAYWNWALIQQARLMQGFPNSEKNALLWRTTLVLGYYACIVCEYVLLAKQITTRVFITPIFFLLVNIFSLSMHVTTMKQLYDHVMMKKSLQTQSREMLETEIQQMEDLFKRPVSKLLLASIANVIGIVDTCVGLLTNPLLLETPDPEHFTTTFSLVSMMLNAYVLFLLICLVTWLPVGQKDCITSTSTAVQSAVWTLLGSCIFPGVDNISDNDTQLSKTTITTTQQAAETTQGVSNPQNKTRDD
eukprot:TRINITY_DN8151_c0_g1_i1.p1 TRINITY_DN8151_c0_g1~~TRINITY_DN8151_c0_g1_i1.p1  ORF type:complete len:338 (+),score=50.97 TRINITY_DN8151_c0_g1_i1:61-1074(+)